MLALGTIEILLVIRVLVICGSGKYSSSIKLTSQAQMDMVKYVDLNPDHKDLPDATLRGYCAVPCLFIHRQVRNAFFTANLWTDQ